ncbi:MAG: peptide-methionine (R)-S-oxide reductase MsrB [Candidatus Liptonbacteria bacterium]|nr:peptide-methionine (R)-S-oxide reductase MsrB [Candidatus Liptonbacteria bacterium]
MKKDSELPPELYKVAREKGTEAPFTGKYWNNHEKGMYKCAVCGAELFSSDTKFDSGTGWPSFTSPSEISPSETLEGKPANDTNIELREDNDFGMKRTEVVCKNCGSHLGHVFDDGPEDKGGKRYCINSVCLELEKENKNVK